MGLEDVQQGSRIVQVLDGIDRQEQVKPSAQIKARIFQIGNCPNSEVVTGRAFRDRRCDIKSHNVVTYMTDQLIQLHSLSAPGIQHRPELVVHDEFASRGVGLV
jgi:hypothetical protein